MEIREVVNYYLNSETNTLEIAFRTILDADDVLRNDIIDFAIVEEYGYDLESESFSFFDDDLDEDVDDNGDTELDEDELINFLNEYYEIHPELLPKSELY